MQISRSPVSNFLPRATNNSQPQSGQCVSGPAVLSSSQAHSGGKSAQLSNVSTLAHDFGSDQTGSVSVWMYSELGSASSGDLQIIKSNSDWANIQQLGTGGFQARICAG